MELALPPMDQHREKTNVESMCISISFLSSLVMDLGSDRGSTRSDLNVRIRFTTTLVPSSVVAATSLISRLRNRIDTGTSQSKSASTRSRNFLSM